VFVRTIFINRAGRRRENRALGNLTARCRGGILALVPQNRVPSSGKDRARESLRSLSSARRLVSRARDLSPDLAPLSASRYCNMLAHARRTRFDHWIRFVVSPIAGWTYQSSINEKHYCCSRLLHVFLLIWSIDYLPY